MLNGGSFLFFLPPSFIDFGSSVSNQLGSPLLFITCLLMAFVICCKSNGVIYMFMTLLNV